MTCISAPYQLHPQRSTIVTMASLFFCLVSLAVFSLSPSLATARAVSTTSGTVYFDGKDYSLKLGVVDKENGAAYGYYEDTLNETGWGVLNIASGYSTSRQYGDNEVMMAAGILEGALTHMQIYDIYGNLNKTFFTGQSQQTIDKVKGFFVEQREWMSDMIVTNANTSDAWYYSGLVYSQFEGLVAGYAMVAPTDQQLEEFAFDLLCGVGDMLDIMNFLFPQQRPDHSTISEGELQSMMLNGGHCSVLIKALPGYENIFASHSSWFVYASMNRIYKHYAFKIARGSPPTEVMSFSSYPGFLVSLDDFYIMDSGLVMLQTTNGIYNKTLYDLATPKALLAWHRVRLANWLASGGREWAGYLTRYNSGTYNNQYMVLDLSKIKLKEAILDDALWVVEQIPGYVESGDQTPILREGYWASYNIPFYEDIFDISGYAALVKKYGPEYSHELYCRAKIFRRDQGNVEDLESMEYIMRYNDYKHDPYSEGSPEKSICSRGDLAEPPSAGGCYDTKVTDFFMAQSLTSYAENGPTHQGLPPFDWRTSGLKAPHEGQPDLFNFTFVRMKPSVP